MKVKATSIPAWSLWYALEHMISGVDYVLECGPRGGVEIVFLADPPHKSGARADAARAAYAEFVSRARGVIEKSAADLGVSIKRFRESPIFHGARLTAVHVRARMACGDSFARIVCGENFFAKLLGASSFQQFRDLVRVVYLYDVKPEDIIELASIGERASLAARTAIAKWLAGSEREADDIISAYARFGRGFGINSDGQYVCDVKIAPPWVAWHMLQDSNSVVLDSRFIISSRAVPGADTPLGREIVNSYIAFVRGGLGFFNGRDAIDGVWHHFLLEDCPLNPMMLRILARDPSTASRDQLLIACQRAPRWMEKMFMCSLGDFMAAMMYVGLVRPDLTQLSMAIDRIGYHSLRQAASRAIARWAEENPETLGAAVSALL